MPASADFGPWANNLSDAERLARWRGLRAAAFLLLGSAHPFIETLRRAETDPDAARCALAELEALPPLPRRRLLSMLMRLQEPSRAAPQ